MIVEYYQITKTLCFYHFSWDVSDEAGWRWRPSSNPKSHQTRSLTSHVKQLRWCKIFFKVHEVSTLLILKDGYHGHSHYCLFGFRNSSFREWPNWLLWGHTFFNSPIFLIKTHSYIPYSYFKVAKYMCVCSRFTWPNWISYHGVNGQVKNRLDKEGRELMLFSNCKNGQGGFLRALTKEVKCPKGVQRVYMPYKWGNDKWIKKIQFMSVR